MSTPHVNLSCVLSLCQKLSNLVDIWRTCDKKNFAQFFWDTVYTEHILSVLLYGIGLLHVSRASRDTGRQFEGPGPNGWLCTVCSSGVDVRWSTVSFCPSPRSFTSKLNPSADIVVEDWTDGGVVGLWWARSVDVNSAARPLNLVSADDRWLTLQTADAVSSARSIACTSITTSMQIGTGIEVNSEAYFPKLREYCPSAEGTRAIFPQLRKYAYCKKVCLKRPFWPVSMSIGQNDDTYWPVNRWTGQLNTPY